MSIESGLKTVLSTISGLNGKVFPANAQEGTQVPYLVYTLGRTDRVRELKTGFDGLVERQYQFDIFHTTYSSLKTIMDSVIVKLKSLIGSTIASYYIQEVDIINEFEVYEKDVNQYRGTIECILFYLE